MLASSLENLVSLMHRGGPVMWLLLGVSVASLSLILERVWFYVSLHTPAGRSAVDRMEALLRKGAFESAREVALSRGSPYARFVLAATDRLARTAGADRPTPDRGELDSLVDEHRRPLERFLPTLSTIITAAPMLGILGTVLGIIRSFELLGQATNAAATDPRAVGVGIAQALLTTAFGLVIALVTLFPYNSFRVQVDRGIGRLERLADAARVGRGAAGGRETPQTRDGS